MKNFQTYLSTVPVYGILWAGFLSGVLIELNRFFPDGLIFPF